MVEDLKRHFSKEDKWITNKHMKRFSTLLVPTGMQVKITRRYYLIPARMVLIKKTANAKCWQLYGKQTLILRWREYKMVQLWITV